MSTLVDERVVEMKFDNSNFEKNTKQTMSTIQKLKSSLNFSGISNSLNKAFNSVDVTPLTYGMEKTSRSFSALEVAMISAISNISNRIVNLGINLVKSLSSDNILAGWSKYNESTISIGTLVSQGNSMDLVTKEMEKLLWFTDQTSYNYQDMVANISKFTAAGIKLEDANKAMQGIANWAAASGQNAMTASRAMYQLSQAIGAGTVKLMDWRSIQNTNMDTVQFREQALEAAVLAGELEKIVDATGKIEYQTKSGKKFNRNQFTEFLSEGWFTSDVLMNTLDEYSKGSEKIREIMDEFDFDSVSEALEIYNKRLDEGVEGYTQLGRTAFLAAQEARTFKDAINATKDAVSTNWLKTYELIFGNYEEATKLWTEFSNHLWEMFASGGTKRNKALKEWRGETDYVKELSNNISEAQKNVDSYAEKIDELSENYKLGLISEKEFTDLKDYYTQMYNDSQKIFENLSNEYSDLKATTDGRLDLFNTDEKDLGAFWNILNTIESITSMIKDSFSEVFLQGKSLKELTEIFQQWTKSLVLSDEAGTNLKNTFKSVFSILKIGLKLGVSIIKGFEPLLDFTKEIITALLRVTSAYSGSVEEFANKSTIFETVTAVISKSLSFLIYVIKGVANVINNVSIKITGKSFFGVIISLAGIIKKAVIAIKESLSEFGRISTKDIGKFGKNSEKEIRPIEKLFNGLKDILMALWHLLQGVVPVVNEMLSFLGEALTSISTMIVGAIKDKDINKLLNFRNLFGAAFWASIIAYFRYMAIFVRQFKKAFVNIFQGVADVLDSKAAMQYAQALKTFATAILIIVASIVLLASIDEAKIAKSLAVITIITGMLAVFMKTMNSIFAQSSDGFVKNITSAVHNFAKAKSLQMMSTTIIAFAAAVVAISAALKILASIDKEKLITALMGLIVIFTLLLASIKIIDKNKKPYSSGGVTMLLMSFAILNLSRAIKKLGELDKSTLKQGAIAIAGIMSILVLFTRTMKLLDSIKVTGIAIGIFGLGIAFTTMAFAIKKLGSIDKKTAIQGVITIAAVYAMVVALSRVTKLLAGIKIANLSIGLFGLGIAFSTMASAINTIGKIDKGSLAKGLLVITGLLTMMTLLTKVLKFGETMSLMVFSASLLVLSTSLFILSKTLSSMGKLDVSSLVKGLGALAAGLAIIVVVGHLLKAVNPSLLAFSASLLLASVAFAIFTVALSLFVGTISLLGSTLVDVLGAFLNAVIEIAPAIGPAVSAIIIGLLEGLQGAVGSLGETLGSLLTMVLNLLNEYAPQIIETVLNIITQLLAGLADRMPEIISSVMSILFSILQAIRDNATELVVTLLEILDNIIIALKEKLPSTIANLVDLLLVTIEALVKAIVDATPRLVTAVFDLVLGIIDGLGQALEDNAAKVRETILKFAEHMWNAFLNFFGIHSPSKRTAEAGGNIIKGIIEGLKKNLANVVKVIVDVGKKMLAGITKFVKGFLSVGVDIMKAFWNGIKSVVSGLLNFISNIWSKIKKFFGIGDNKQDFKDAGKEMIVSYQDGMESAQMDVNKAAKAVIQETIDTLSKTDIFEMIGEDIANKIADGIYHNSSIISEMIQETVYDISSAIYDEYGEIDEDDPILQYFEQILSIIENELTDEDLTIRPVMDLSDIQAKTGMIAAGLAAVDGMTINTNRYNAEKVASEIASNNQSSQRISGDINSPDGLQNGAYSFVFNMYGVNDPKELADQVSKIFQQEVSRR